MNFPACLILVNLLWLMGKVTPAVIVEAPTTGDYCFTTDPIREQPYDFSEDWQEQKKEIYQEGSEYTKFRKSPEFLNVLTSVSKRGGYRDVQAAEKVELIFKACTYEQAWRIHEPSSWCSLFTPDDVKVLEYLHDLEEYYLSGSGSELNKLLPLELLDNFLNHFVNESEPRVVAFFAHSTIIELFLTSIGLAEDEMDLRADNYEEMENRKWRTSLLAPFAGNLAVVGFTCKPQSKNHLMFILNEKILSVVN
uniref:Multiple inositol polyphosphate phosphatase 1 n=1 Tax=Lutzomyia longipalpis TaxID=7200 RepID=A0A1B0CIG4_LUTLO